MISIYTLSDPITLEVKYVGKTSKKLNQRLSSHLAAKTKTKVLSWIISLKNKELTPIIELIDLVEEENWQFWEKYWIQQCRSWGFNLKNMTEGGDGATGSPNARGKRSEETKNKIKAKRKLQIITQEHKNNISKAMLRSKILRSPESRKKYSEAKKIPVGMFSVEGTLVQEFCSYTEACKKLNNKCLAFYLNKSRLYKKTFILKHIKK